jgi:hypothetical protein
MTFPGPAKPPLNASGCDAPAPEHIHSQTPAPNTTRTERLWIVHNLCTIDSHVWTARVIVCRGSKSSKCRQQCSDGRLRITLVRPGPIETASRLTSIRVEKYRPVYLDDVVGNSETIERLKIIAKDGNMPHVIISGMPGIGKTTSILCLARTLLGDAYKEAVLELNASDERGIDVVRNRIKGFAQKKVTLPPGRHKLVILDEADRYGMTKLRICRSNARFLA